MIPGFTGAFLISGWQSPATARSDKQVFLMVRKMVSSWSTIIGIGGTIILQSTE
jgi:hypothetical protein